MRFDYADRPVVRTRRDPVVTALHVMMAVCAEGAPDRSGKQRAIDPHLAHHLRHLIPPAVRHTVFPDPWCAPEALSPEVGDSDSWLDDAAAAMADVDADDFSATLERHYRGNVPACWTEVRRRPRRWLHLAAKTYLAAGEALVPFWRSAKPRIDVELAVLERGLADRTTGSALNSVSPYLRADADGIAFKYGSGMNVAPHAEVNLTPFVGATDGWIITATTTRTDLCYSVPGPRPRAGRPEPLDRGDALSALLGPARAELIRNLDQPRTIDEVVRSGSSAHSTVSFHLTQLEQRLLVQRVRRGRATWVVRTDAGSAIVDLLSGG